MRQILTLLIGSVIACGCDTQPPAQALGTIERDRVTLTATSSEVITHLPIREGEQVQIGDVLVQLDTRKQKTVLAKAKSEQAKASAYLLRLTNGERPQDIAAAKARVSSASAYLTEAENNYRRIIELVKQKLASQSQKDTALAARDSAKANQQSAQEEYEKLLAGARPEDIDQAKAALEATNAEVDYQQQKLNELTITATRNGILDSLPYNLGERVPHGAYVAVIQADTIPYARVYIPEAYRVRIKSGDTLSVHVDGISQTFTGTVRQIANTPSYTPYYALTEKERSRLMYLAEIDLLKSADTLPSGIPAQVDLNEAKNNE